MILSIEQTKELLDLINSNQLIVILKELGPDFLTEGDKTLLTQHGIEWKSLYNQSTDTIFTSFHYGILAEALGHAEVDKITFEELRQYIKGGEYIPITPREQATINAIKWNAFTSLKSLNNKIFQDVTGILTDHSKKNQAKFIAQEFKQGTIDKKSISEISNTIAEKTGDWSRDFDRIIEYASQTAFQQGKAETIEKRFGTEAKVYKKVFEGACKHCIRLYLTGGISSEPKIFKLSELQANGDNIGLKVAEWKPIVGATHPYCRCHLLTKPEGYIWNSTTQSFDTVDKEYIPKTASGIERPKVRAWIGKREVLV